MYCLYCGSQAVRPKTERRYAQVEYGSRVGFDARADECLECGEVDDFTDRNSAAQERATYESEVVACGVLISWVRQQTRMADQGIERMLRLPAGTLRYWEHSGPSEGAYALLRMVQGFPALLDWLDRQLPVPPDGTKDVV